MSIAVYARKSVERENSISCETQIEYCRSMIKPDERNEKVITFVDNGFSGGNVNRDGFQKMMKLISTVKAYGAGAVIFAAPEFVAEMGADVIVPVSAGMPGVHPQDLDAIHNTGYINIFRGTPIVQIPQSFIDESNTKTWINPQFAYVLPTGKEKVVKVVLEGDSIVRDYQNRDGSMEIYLERKMGTAILAQYNWGIYQNTGITDTSESPYGI